MSQTQREPTDAEMVERYVLEGDPEEALRQFLVAKPARARDPEADDERGQGDGDEG